MAETVAQLNVIIAAETDQLSAGLKAASSDVQSFGQSIQQGIGLGAGMAVVTGAVQAVGAAFGALKGSVIDFNQQLDQSRAVFTRYFEGNAATAESFLTTLKGFAATTPFEFKDLSTFAIRLQNANTNANDIIPTLKAIGNAASSTGSLSTESVDRITLALTQMQMKGKVSGEEMLQLTEANIPAWNILSQATGKSTAELQKMASAGEISADVFTNAFRDMYENAGLMEGASKSLAGALSTISDVGTQAFADIGRSVYELATEGANALAQFLSGEDFQTWVTVAKTGVDAVVQSIRDMLAALAPVGEVLATAFHQLTAGDFVGAFQTVSDALTGFFGDLLTGAQQFAQQMFGAGSSLIGEYAAGILEGANDVLVTAMDAVTSTIAAFLIGQSPPPEGPLKDIAKGGAATIDAWGQGAAEAADKAVRPAAEAIAGNLGELKLAGKDADSAIREIARAIQDVESASRDVKYAADDIKDAYDDQIKAIDDQLKALKDVHDTQRDREKLELSLEEVQLRQAEIAAMGDKELRAQLQTRLAGLKASEAQRKNADALADAEAALGGSEKDRLKTQMEAQKLADQERDIRARMKTARGPERDRLASQLQELEGRRELGRLEAADRQQAAQRRVADAQAKKDELSIQSQIDGLVDKEGLARVKTQQDALRARREDLTLQEQAAKLEREIAALPLQEQRAQLVAEKEALLKPMQEQLETLGKQKTALGDQRQEWQNVKADIAEATKGIKEQETAVKAVGKAVKEASDQKLASPVDKAFTPDAAAQAAVDRAKKSGEGLVQAFQDGLSSTFDRIIPPAIRDRLTSLTQQVQTQGMPALVAAIGAGLGAAVPVLASKLSEWTSVFLVWSGENQQRFFAAHDHFQAEYHKLLEEVAPQIADALVGWASAFMDWAGTTGLDLLDVWARNIGDFLSWIGRQVTLIAGKLLDWATEFVAWVGPVIPKLLTELGTLVTRVVEWMGEHLGELLDALGKWAVEFVEWVAPKIPPLLLELGKLLVELTGWIITTALPAIVEKLAEWGLAIVAWVAPRIPPLLEELGKLLLELGGWIITVALPAIVLKLAEWGAAFLGWVAKDVIPTLADTLGQILTGIQTWVGQKVVDITTSAAELGKGMLEGIKKGLTDNWSTLTDWITENIGKKLPEWMQSLLGIKSPSSVFADIGENLIAGLILGMERKKGDLIESLKNIALGMAGSGGEVGGDVEDWLKAALAITGVDAGWLGGLKRLVSWESSGNPTAVNPETVNGQHATGLLQTLPSTFRAYKMPGMDDILNPIHNAVAAIRYIDDTYGSVYKIPGIASGDHSAFPGYAEGGIVTKPTLAWIGERGPEAVVPLGRSGGFVPAQTVRIDVAVGGRLAEEIYVTGRDLAIRRGRAPTAGRP
jgi:tape measure domain-containing protein